MKSKEQKAKDCQERAEKFQSLTPQQRWELLDQRLGKNIGAKRQRAKLIAECPELAPVVEEKDVDKILKSIPNSKTNTIH
jgi:hypothetical protein